MSQFKLLATATPTSEGKYHADFSWRQVQSVDTVLPGAAGTQAWTWFGDQNTYPQDVEDVYANNYILNRVVNWYGLAIVGDDWAVRYANKEDTESREYLEACGLTKRMIRELGQDMALHNGIAIKIDRLEVEELDGRRHWEYAFCRVPFSQVRAGKQLDDMGLPTHYYISGGWIHIKRSPNAIDPANAPIVDYVNVLNAPPFWESAILVCWLGSLTNSFYPMPDVNPCLADCQLLNALSKFSLQYIKNGMAPSAVLKIPYIRQGTGNEISEADRIGISQVLESVQQQFSGADKAGLPAIIVYDATQLDNKGDVLSPEIEAAPVDTGVGKFEVIRQAAIQSIFTGLGVISPELMGVSRASGFTSQSETLLTAYQLTMSTVVKPKRNVLLEALDYLVGMLGLNGSVRIIDVPPIAKTVELAPQDKDRAKIIAAEVSTGALSKDEAKAQLSILCGLTDEQADALLAHVSTRAAALPVTPEQLP